MNRKRVIRWTICFIVLVLLAAVFLILELAVGSAKLSLNDVIGALTGDSNSSA